MDELFECIFKEERIIIEGELGRGFKRLLPKIRFWDATVKTLAHDGEEGWQKRDFTDFETLPRRCRSFQTGFYHHFEMCRWRAGVVALNIPLNGHKESRRLGYEKIY